MKGMPTKIEELKAPSQTFTGGASTDVGEISLLSPTATIRFPGNVPKAISHHWSSVSCTFGSTAWKGLNAGAQAIAASAIDLLTMPAELKKIQTEFQEYSEKHLYKSFLPASAKPPLKINLELMGKWRPLMKKNYQLIETTQQIWDRKNFGIFLHAKRKIK